MGSSLQNRALDVVSSLPPIMTSKRPVEERLFAALQRLTELSQENCSLRAENAELRSRLNIPVQGYAEPSSAADRSLDEQLKSACDVPSTLLSKAEKVAILPPTRMPGVR